VRGLDKSNLGNAKTAGLEGTSSLPSISEECRIYIDWHNVWPIFLSQKAEKRCSQNVRDEKDAKKEIVLISLSLDKSNLGNAKTAGLEGTPSLPSISEECRIYID
jgi:hypothetical protein